MTDGDAEILTDADESKPSKSGGMWGWIPMVISAVFAMPRSMSEAESPITGEKAPRNLGWFFNLKWMNPLRWIPKFSILTSDHGPPESPTTFLEPAELAEYYGYTAENHRVTTEDGYIIELHRLPSGRRKKITEDGNKSQDAARPRPPILVHHAFLTSSREFLLLGPRKALAFVLADAGFDVWLCNARGNTHSRNHTTLKPNQKEFWNFSFHEHGTQDLPAVINYVLNESGRSKLHYLGHSMGTTAFFVMSSERPQMLNKIKTFSAMGPVTSAAPCRSTLLRFIFSTMRITMAGLKIIGMYEFLPHYRWLTLAGQTICQNGVFTQRICTDFFLSPLSGKSSTMSSNIIPEMLAHTPAGTSIKTLSHFAQNYHSGFRNYDYGPKKNIERYHSKSPPFYNLEAVNVPTQIFYAMNDLMADYTDAQNLCNTLPNVFKCQKVPDDTFTHLDFIWSDVAHTILYPEILEGIKRFEDFTAEEKES